MAMGARKRHAHQASMWVATQDLPRSAARPSCARLHQMLDQHDFDSFVEGWCVRFSADEGRPGLPPGRDFRVLLIGYFEGLDAERAIAWRAADSLPCASVSDWCCPKRRLITRRFPARGA
jgi:transposase